MSNLPKIGLLASVLALAGCATAPSADTYSGGVLAAAKATGNAVSTFVRKPFSKPMPAWTTAPDVGSPPPTPTIVATDESITALPVDAPSSNAVQVNPVTPESESGHASWTVEPGPSTPAKPAAED